MTHHLRTRIVLANGGHAKWLERQGQNFVTIAELEADRVTAVHPKGTTHHSASPLRHGAGEADLAAMGRDRFGRIIAERLNRQSSRGEFERLAIIAPPEVLRAIRQNLLPGALNKIVHEASKDLVKTPADELGAWLNTPLIG